MKIQQSAGNRGDLPFKKLRLAKVDQARARVQQGRPIRQKIHPQNPVHGSAGRIPKVLAHGSQGSHRDIKNSNVDLTKKQVLQPRMSQRNSIA